MRLSEVEGVRRHEADVEDVELEYAEDYYYERECGYTLVRMLRGRTTGRKLKRLVWKCGCYQVLDTYPLLTHTSSLDHAVHRSFVGFFSWL